MATTATPREVTINLRARTSDRELIDRAASASGTSRSEFMLDAACERARDVLLDTTSFALDGKRHARFLQMIERPARIPAGLARLLAAKAPWER